MYNLNNQKLLRNPDTSITDPDFIWKNKPATYQVGLVTLGIDQIEFPDDRPTQSNSRMSFSQLPLVADVLERLMLKPRQRYKNIYTGIQAQQDGLMTLDQQVEFLKLYREQDIWQMSMFIKFTILWETYKKEGKFRHPLCANFNIGTGKWIIDPGVTRLTAMMWHGVKEFQCIGFADKLHANFDKVFNSHEEIKEWHADFYKIEVIPVAKDFWIPAFFFDNPKTRSDSLIKEYYSKIRQFWLTHNLCWTDPKFKKIIYWEPRTATGNCHITVTDRTHIPQAIAIAPLYDTWENDNIKIVNTHSVTAPE